MCFLDQDKWSGTSYQYILLFPNIYKNILSSEMHHLIEFAKLRVMHAIPASVINVPKACQLLIFTCQRAKGVPIFQFGMSMCQKACHFFQLHLRKGVPIFQRFFKRITFFMFIIYLYLIYFIYFVCFKYIPNIYFLY